MQLDLAISKTLHSGKRTFQLCVAFQTSCQRTVILGQSGSGKSLTLKAIAGLVKPDRGHIRLNGRTLFDTQWRTNLPPQQREVAYLFQDYALFPHLNVRQNIAFGLSHGWLNPARHQANQAVDYWLDSFNLNHLAHQYPDELSGGQRQRTALARALVAKPRALLLDEPFAALDLSLRAKMRQELDALQKRLQVPMVLITHDPEDAHMFGEQLIRLHDGQIPPEAANTASVSAPIRC